MKRICNIKQLACAAVATATVISAGCIAMADETDIEEQTSVQTDAAQNDADADGSGDVINDEQQAITEEETVAGPTEEYEDEVFESDEETEDGKTVYESEETIVTIDAAYGVPSGWQGKDGVWYYYVDGNPVTGWQKIGTEWYCFSEGGVMNTGMYVENTSDKMDYYILDYKGQMRTGWQEFNSSWYYCNANGKAQRGWKKIDGKWYYFNPDEGNAPWMYSGFNIIDGQMYMFDESGAMITGWYESYGIWYYGKNDGTLAAGWQKIGDKWYYFHDDGSQSPYMYRNSIFQIDDGYYAFNEDGSMATGWYNSNVVVIDGKKIYRGNWSYFDKTNGRAKTGWQKIDNKWYYFDKSSLDAYRGVQLIDGKWYYFDENSLAMKSNEWITNGYSWSYANSDGELASGWKTIGGKRYYFADSGYAPYMQTGFLLLEGKKYYLGSDGVLRTGWIKYEGSNKYHYADSDGVIVIKGWKTIDGKDYYFEYEDMVTGLRFVDGILFDFGTDGACRNPAKG